MGAISLGWRPDGTRIRRKVTGRTKTDVREKLKRLRVEADAGLKTSASYTLAKAVDDWAAEALDGLAAKTVRSHVDLLRPVTMLIGQIPLRDLTAHDVRRTLNKLAETRSTRTMASTHNVLVHAIRHAEANDHSSKGAVIAKITAIAHPGRCPLPWGGDGPQHSGQHPLDLTGIRPAH